MDKISYLKGLMEGLGVHPESREGKLFGAVCEALEESADYAKKLEDRIVELEELCSILDEDLSVIEELVDDEEGGCSACPSSDTKIKYYYPEEEQKDVNDADEDAIVPSLTANEDDDTDGDFLDNEEYETICPTCGKVILLDDHMLEEGETTCPNCGEELEFDFDEEEIEKLAPSSDEETDE